MRPEVDPAKMAELAAALKNDLSKYREWALNPLTARFLTLAADYVTPYPSTPQSRASHAESVAALVQKETVEAFLKAVFTLEDLAGFSDEGVLPEPDYGAAQATPKPRQTRKPAKPPQA